MANQTQILWPSRYDPEKTPVHVHNELAIASLPEVVWAWLIRAPLWPTWYPNASNICFLSGNPPDLALGTRFRWKTFGVTIESTVLEFVPYERVGWDGHANGLDVYDAWLLQKTDLDFYVIVVTKENQRRWLARLGKALRPKKMEQQHQIWLEGLRAKSTAVLPSDP